MCREPQTLDGVRRYMSEHGFTATGKRRGSHEVWKHDLTGLIQCICVYGTRKVSIDQFRSIKKNVERICSGGAKYHGQH